MDCYAGAKEATGPGLIVEEKRNIATYHIFYNKIKEICPLYQFWYNMCQDVAIDGHHWEDAISLPTYELGIHDCMLACGGTSIVAIDHAIVLA